MTAPQRIQRRRTKGWRMPEGAVYVGRPTKWGNPFVVGEREWDAETHMQAVEWYRSWMTVPGNWTWPTSQPDPTELRKRNLVCWCRPDQPCHADVLLDLANGERQ